MNPTVKKLLLTGVLLAASVAAPAQTPVHEPPPAAIGPTGSSSQVESRLASGFSGFAGSESNAQSLVTGLRQGSEITLTAPGAQSPGPAPVTDTTFVPPTRPMGYGNVRIALSLAREQLAQAGVNQPTPEQIRTALMGGTITTTHGTPGAAGTTTTSTPMQGVLQMRADGMGWGQIANSMGVKLGAVMSGRTVQASPTVPSTQTPGPATTASVVTTASGAASAGTQVRARGNGMSAQQNVHAGSGIVNAAGGGAGLGAGAHAGTRTGIVTGGNATAGSRASATGLAHGKGLARP